jgi:cadmium resistance protein CadD (predicted permease)
VEFPGLVAIIAFAATDIDDLFLLMIFYSSRTFPARQVTLGQFIGISVLIAISVLGSLVALVIPTYVIGLLGLVPLAIGIKNLIEVRNSDKISSMHTVPKKNNSYLTFLSVAAVTISNGGDNIGVYVPLFSKYNTVDQITVLTSVFIAMTAVWCIAAYYLVNHPVLASRIRYTGNIIMPFVLIGLGIYILADSFLFIQ